MAVWLTRAGKHGEDESAALEKGRAIVGWREMPHDVSSIESYEEMKKKHLEAFPDMSPKAIMNNAAQLWSFTKRIQIGDIAVLPLKTRSAIAIGKVTGNYQYFEDRHTRPVQWIRDDVPRGSLGQDLLYSLGAFMTVCEIKRNNAEMRIQSVMNGQPDPNLGPAPPPKIPDVPTDDDLSRKDHTFVDLQEQAFDQIRMMIESKFKGHNLARLVEAILNARGYYTYRSTEGSDGGVDILAGRGPMGFEESRLCVQVKSGGIQNDGTIRELEGVMSRMGAQKGLFVSWDGFNKTALLKTRDLFFKVRLWDDKKFMEALLEDYEKLSEEIQAELPLKRIWVIVPEET
jgi:restriction system protein